MKKSPTKAKKWKANGITRATRLSRVVKKGENPVRGSTSGPARQSACLGRVRPNVEKPPRENSLDGVESSGSVEWDHMQHSVFGRFWEKKLCIYYIFYIFWKHFLQLIPKFLALLQREEILFLFSFQRGIWSSKNPHIYTYIVKVMFYKFFFILHHFGATKDVLSLNFYHLPPTPKLYFFLLFIYLFLLFNFVVVWICRNFIETTLVQVLNLLLNIY